MILSGWEIVGALLAGAALAIGGIASLVVGYAVISTLKRRRR